MSTEVQLCIPVVAFHTHRMCMCFSRQPFCCTFSHPDCMLGQMLPDDTWTAAGSNSLLRVFVRVTDEASWHQLASTGCNYYGSGYTIKAFHHFSFWNQIMGVVVTPLPSFPCVLRFCPTPQLCDFIPVSWGLKLCERRQLLYGGKGGP